MSMYMSEPSFPLCLVCSYLRESTIVPEITLMWEAVADETKLALLDILLASVMSENVRTIPVKILTSGSVFLPC